MLDREFSNCVFLDYDFFRNRAIIVFVLSFILRLALLYVVITNVTYLAPDSFDYIYLARNIGENNIYGSLNNPELFRVPLYPLLISGFLLIFKTYFISALLIFQAILDSLTAVLVMKSVHLLFKENSENIGLMAGILYSLSPLCIVYSTKVLSETVFVFLFLFLFVVSLKVINRNNVKKNVTLYYLIFIGILAGVLCLTRAVFIPLSILFLFWIALRVKKAKYVLVLVIFFSVIPGVWILRNYHTSGYVGITTISAVNMYRYDACSVLAKIHSIGFVEQQSKIDAELSKIPTQKEISEYCTKRAVSVVKAHPLLYIYLQCKNSLNTLLPAVNDLFESFGITIGGKGTLGVIHSKGLFEGIKYYFNGRYDLLWIALPLTFALLIFYSFVFYGIYVGFKRTAGIVVMDHFFILLLLVYFLIAGGAASTPRFRMPLEPFLCIYAAAGVIFLIRVLKHSQKES